MNIPAAIIFDINETLLDLSPLKQSINTAFKKDLADLWFARLLHYSLVETATGNYHDFSEIAAAVLQMMARTEGKEWNEDSIQKILAPVTRLEAYPDVKPGLSSLKKAGIKLLAFSNGKPAVLQEQLEHAGIDDYFDLVFSVEEMKKYKPHTEAYRFILNRIGLDPADALMVAAHGWDIYGAASSGLKTCFVARSGKTTYPLAKSPDISINTITELAGQFTRLNS